MGFGEIVPLFIFMLCVILWFIFDVMKFVFVSCIGCDVRVVPSVLVFISSSVQICVFALNCVKLSVKVMSGYVL